MGVRAGVRARGEGGVLVNHEEGEDFWKEEAAMGGGAAAGGWRKARVLTLENISTKEGKTLTKEREN